MYVDNLPRSMSKRWLWQLFHYEGRVVDAYISYKQRNHTSNLFGFVRFHDMKDARRAMNNHNGMVIHKCKILVQVATYSRKHSVDQRIQMGVIQSTTPKFRQNTRVERTFKEVLMGKKENDDVSPETKKQGVLHHHSEKNVDVKNNDDKKPNYSVFIKSEVCDKRKESSDRSCVGVLRSPAEVHTIASKLAYPSLGI